MRRALSPAARQVRNIALSALFVAAGVFLAALAYVAIAAFLTIRA